MAYAPAVRVYLPQAIRTQMEHADPAPLLLTTHYICRDPDYLLLAIDYYGVPTMTTAMATTSMSTMTTTQRRTVLLRVRALSLLRPRLLLERPIALRLT